MSVKYQILRALRKLGFEGETLKHYYLYFSGIDPFTASVCLSAMLHAKESQERRKRRARV